MLFGEIPSFDDVMASIRQLEKEINLCPANQREHHCLVLAHGQIIHKAAPKRFVEFRHRLGQLFQFRDEPLELPPADIALADVGSHLFALCLGGLVTADRGVVHGHRHAKSRRCMDT